MNVTAISEQKLSKLRKLGPAIDHYTARGVRHQDAEMVLLVPFARTIASPSVRASASAGKISRYTANHKSNEVLKATTSELAAQYGVRQER